MANDVRVRFKSHLPGGGFDSSGGAKQGKTRVVGAVTVTSYVKAGEGLSAIDIGLTTIDCINLRVSDSTGDQNGQSERVVRYDKSVGQFYLLNHLRTGEDVPYANAATETLEFDALGDGAGDVELT